MPIKKNKTINSQKIKSKTMTTKKHKTVVKPQRNTNLTLVNQIEKLLKQIK